MRSQSAIEFLSVYAFALVAIAVIISIAVILGTSNRGSNDVYSTCSIEPLLPCKDAAMMFNSIGGYSNYTVLFINQVGYTLYFPANALNLTTTDVGVSGTAHTLGNCYPSYAGDGSEVLCNATVEGHSSPGIGSTTDAYFRISYQLCSTSNTITCYTGAYNTTGYSVTSIGTPGSYLEGVTISSANGVVVIDGAVYPSGSHIYLSNGKYTIYASPSAGYGFYGWQWSSGSQYLQSASTQNTVLTVTTGGTLTAEIR